MKDTILIGREGDIHEVPAESWKSQLAGIHEVMEERLSFMTAEHHLVRTAAVRELPRNSGRPLRPAELAEVSKLPLSRVRTILDELEERLFFLARNDNREVSWAFPVTTDRTPHRLSFSTGERLFGA